MRTTFLAALAAALLVPMAHAEDDPPSAAEMKAAYTEQLLEVLAKTRSTDTFLVTLALLVESKPEPTTVVPIVLMQAERLGIFGDNLTDPDSPKMELAGEVKDMILQLQKPAGRNASSPFRQNRAPVQNYSGAAIPAPAPEARTPLQPALTPGKPAPDVPAPSDAEILRALPRRTAVVRDDVQIVKEKVVDKVDAPRFFPLVGVAQLRHVHWKCTAYFTETVGGAAKPRVEVVYIDKDQLHLTK